MSSDSHASLPVIIGIGQHVHRAKEVADAKDPLDLIETAIRNAEQDAGSPNLARKIDTLCLVNILSRPPEGLPQELADRIKASPNNQAYTWVGASAPQWFVNRTADKISTGRARLALICGAEAFYSKRILAKAGDARGWTMSYPQKESWMVGDLRDPVTSLEIKYGLVHPLHFYPLFENALRYSEGLSIEENRQELGNFCAAMSTIAAENQHAWFRTSRSSEEIRKSTSANRMAAFPYTKTMCSIMDVDQAAAIFLTDEKTAGELGIPREKWVYPVGAGDASDIWHVSLRRDLHSSPSVELAARKATEQAGVTIDEIDFFDFYSCFPCAPRITRRMMGIEKDDPRPLTVIGGMPYFGGPGNNYSMHAICHMVELLRREPEKIGLVQALSWFISKHSVGVYSGVPRNERWVSLPPENYQKELADINCPQNLEEAEGPATVETFTLFHDRDGEAVGGVVFGKLEDGSRCLAKLPDDPSVFHSIMSEEFVGNQGEVSFENGFNIFKP